MKPVTRVAVLASGGGSNLQALIDYQKAMRESASYKIVLVASDKAGSGALDRARKAQIDVETLDGSTYGDELIAMLSERQVDLVVLAGFLRLLPPGIVKMYDRHIINIHPAPLPQFGGKGMHGRRVHEAVLAADGEYSGATVHFVNERYDDGPPIAFYRVPVQHGDTSETLGARVLRAEHILLPRVVRALAEGAVRLELNAAYDPSLSNAENARALDLKLSTSAA